MPVELTKCGGLKADVNMREGDTQRGASSSSLKPADLASEFARTVNVKTPSTESNISTPSSVGSPFSSSSSGPTSPPKFVVLSAPPPIPARFEEKKAEFPFVGLSTGKRKTYSSQDSPTLECAEVMQTNTLSKEQAEENIRGLEIRYQCDLSAKKIKADKIKAATNKSTIERLALELQMEYLRQAEYASKEAIYKYVTDMRTVAKVLFVVSLTLVNRSRRTSTQRCEFPGKRSRRMSWPSRS